MKQQQSSIPVWRTCRSSMLVQSTCFDGFWNSNSVLIGEPVDSVCFFSVAVLCSSDGGGCISSVDSISSWLRVLRKGVKRRHTFQNVYFHFHLILPERLCILCWNPLQSVSKSDEGYWPLVSILKYWLELVVKRME